MFSEIIELVKGYPSIVDKPFRPLIGDATYEDINTLMKKCWSEEPSDRPDFQAIKMTIRKINK